MSRQTRFILLIVFATVYFLAGVHHFIHRTKPEHRCEICSAAEKTLPFPISAFSLAIAPIFVCFVGKQFFVVHELADVVLPNLRAPPPANG